MRRAINRSSLILVALVLLMGHAAVASAPPLARIDAQARAGGNRKELAIAIGERVFARTQPAQVFQVLVNAVGTHVVVGMRVSGEHFHGSLTRAQFDAEIASLARDTFAAVPQAEELDIWTTVPIVVPKGTIVSGDLALPTMRNVLTISVMHGESTARILARLRSGKNVFVDTAWAASAFEKAR